MQGSGRAWLVTVGALAAFLVGRAIPIPGLDTEALRESAFAAHVPTSFIGWQLAAPIVSLFGICLVPLLVVSLAAEVVPGVRRWAALVYLLLCAGAGFAQAVYLEHLGDEAMFYVPSVVLEPGLWFKVVATLTFTAGGAVLWALSRWVTERGVVFGPVLFAGAVAITEELSVVMAAGQSFLVQEEVLATPVVRTLPWLITLFALWRYRPEWPVAITGDAKLRSSWDALLLPGALSIISGEYTALSFIPANIPLPDALQGLRPVAFLLSTAVAISVLMGLRSHATRRGSPAFMVFAALVPIPALLVTGVPLALGAVKALQPGPFAGGASFEVSLSCPEADAARTELDVTVLRQRLEQQRVRAEVSSSGAGKVRLRLEQVSGAQPVLEAVLPPSRLEFLMVSSDQTPVSPELFDVSALGLRVDANYEGVPQIVGESEVALRPILDAVRSEGALVPAVECADDRGRPRCAVLMLETASAMRDDFVDEAEALIDAYGMPTVSITMTPEGAARFEALTAANVRRKLAIVLDGKVTAAPVIHERIPGGRAQITLGRTGAPEDLRRQADRLAQMLTSGSLTCSWQVDSIR